MIPPMNDWLRNTTKVALPLEAFDRMGSKFYLLYCIHGTL